MTAASIHLRQVGCLFAFLLALALGGCAKPVPVEKAAYVGEWRGAVMALDITPEGRVAYLRQEKGMKTTINAPLKEFVGDNFVVGIGPLTTTFAVTAAPHLDGTAWKMTVDGVELTRK